MKGAATASRPSPGQVGIVFGYVPPPDEETFSETIGELGAYLQDRLSMSVEMRRFAAEPLLYSWLKNYREVDVAWLSQDYLRQTPPGELFRVAKVTEHSAVFPFGELVAHQSVNKSWLKQIRKALVEMPESSSGRDLLAQLKLSQFIAPARWLTPEWEGDVASPTRTKSPSVSPRGAAPVAGLSPSVKPVIRALPASAPVRNPSMPHVVADMDSQTFRVVTPSEKEPAELENASIAQVAEESGEVADPALAAPAAHNAPLSDVAVAPQSLAEPVPVSVTRDEAAPASAAATAVVVTAEDNPEPVDTPAAGVAANEVATSPEVAPALSAVASATPPADAEEKPASQEAGDHSENVRPAQESEGYQHLVGQIVVPEQQSLRGLFDKTTISVLANIGGAFVTELSNHQLSEDESAIYEDEANLLESISVGRSFNRESRAALARTEQAKAQTRQAFGLLLPNATLRYSKGREKSKPSVETDEVTGELISSSTHTRTDAAFVVRQSMFDLPSYLDWRRREVIEEARGENYRISDGDAFVATVDAYLSLVSSRLQTDVTRDFESQLVNLFNYIEKRTNAGASSVSDMARVDARRESTQSFRLEQESAHTTAWYEFVRLTNLIPSRVRLPVLEDIGASQLPETFDQAVATAMQKNPEIASLRAELHAAKIDQEVSKGRYWPRLGAEYTYNFSEHAGGQTNPEDQRDHRLMAVLDWELFAGGRDLNEVRERMARHNELRYRLDDQQRRVLQELSANYTALSTTRERITSGYQELQSITTAAEAMSKRMLSGNQSLLDLLDVYDRLFRARSRLINLHTLEMNTITQLVRLTLGTPWAVTEPAGESSEKTEVSRYQSLELETKTF